MAYDAGSARSSYILDTSQARQAAEELKRIFADIKAAQAQSSAPLPAPSTAPVKTATAEEIKLAQAIARTAEAEARRAAATARKADADAKAGINAARQAAQEQKLAQELAKTAAAEDRAATAALRRQQAEQRAARQNQNGGLGPALPRTLEAFGGQAIDQIKSGLLGVVGPAALATTTFTALKGALDFTESAFRFKAAFDQTTAAISLQLRGVRDSSLVFADAAKFAGQYAFTQEETNAALRSSVGILRVSKSSASDLLGVLSRLQIASPEQSLEGAALAVKELASGDVQSLVERFEISRTAANQMKAEIQGGADVVTVLNKYLNDSGVTMDSLAIRTQGAAGKMNDLKTEAEQFRLAVGGEAGGVGGALIGFETQITRGAARLFGGSGGLTESFRQIGASLQGSAVFAQVYAQALANGATNSAAFQQATNAANTAAAAFVDTQQGWVSGGGALNAVMQQTTDIEQLRIQHENDLSAALGRSANAIQAQIVAMQASAEKSIIDAAAKDAQQAKTALLQQETKAAVNAFLALNPNIDAAGVAALVAAGKIPPLIGQLAALRLASDNARDGLALLAAQQNVLASIQKGLSGAQVTTDKVAGAIAGLGGGAGSNTRVLDTANRIRASENALALARAKNAQERIAILQRELGQTNDIAEKNRILAQIESEKQSLAKSADSAAKARTTELDKQVSLEERIRDAKTAQLRASLEVQKLAGQDVLDRLKEQQELAKADRILRSGRASAEFKAAAAAREQIIGADQQLRQLDIAEKTLTAGGQIINGRVFQSRQAAVQAGAIPAGAAGVPTAGAAAPAGGAAGQGITLKLVDAAGRILAETVAPFILQDMQVGLAQSNAGGAGA